MRASRLSILILISLGFYATRAAAQTEGRLLDIWGVRVGLGSRSQSNGVKPLINPSYYVPFGKVLLSSELLLVFRDFQAINLPSFSDFTLDSYGFRASARLDINGHSTAGPFVAGGIGFDVFQTLVSFTPHLLLGTSIPIGSTSQFETAASVEPLFFFGHSPAVRASLCCGIRLLNFKP